MDLDEFRIDCRNKHAQINFLYSQMPSRTQEDLASLNMLAIYNTDRKLASGARKREIQAWIDQVNRRCID